jgi:hypothetical protein
MEANIHVFSKQQELKRRQLLLKAFEQHSLVITAESLETMDPALIFKLSEVCSICLGSYQVGDIVVQSSNESCQHIFHRDCLLAFLMTRQSPLCPCCRQTYIRNSESRISDEESTCIDVSSGDFESGRQTEAESDSTDDEPYTLVDPVEPRPTSIEPDHGQGSSCNDDEPTACISLSPSGNENDTTSIEGQLEQSESD